jgi:hypothetical protein
MGCSKKRSSSNNNNEYSNINYTKEVSYCSPLSSASGLTVTATGYFLAREVTTSGLEGPLPAQAIRRAEVEILNSSGEVIQCGETDDSGIASLTIPSQQGQYTFRFNSRAFNSYYKASVLYNTTSNKFYSLEKTFSISASDLNSANIDLGDVTADYKCPAGVNACILESGAFNILEQILKVNEYLRSHSTCSFCTSFTVAPKIQIYWARGFNPSAYFGDSSVGLSFFMPSDNIENSSLYILGGMNGDSDNSDTDHFDNAVIIHEYAHFLQNVYQSIDYYKRDPSHNGNSIIDPRLAWAEGWANFFEGAVLNTSNYRDTTGNTSGHSTRLNVNLSLELQTQDAPTYTGQGVFREVSVSRTLWDFIDSATGGDNFGAEIPFSYLWSTITSSNTTGNQRGFNSAVLLFKNIGLFSMFLKERVSVNLPSKISSMNSLLANEKQVADLSEFGLPISSANSSCSAFIIQGVPNVSSPSGIDVSDLQRSNDFYDYYYDGSTPFEVKLEYATVTGAPDLDLIIYKSDFGYDRDDSKIGFSTATGPAESLSTNELGGRGLEVVRYPASLPAGHYMINVKMETNSWGGITKNYRAQYILKNSSGVRLCP